MERNEILDGGKMLQQSAANDLILRREIEKLTTLSQTFSTISQNAELKGAAANALRQQMVDYKDLIDSAISMNNRDVADNTTAYFSFIDYKFVGDEIIQGQINALNDKRYDEGMRDFHYREWMNSTWENAVEGALHYYSYLHYCNCVDSDQREYERWKYLEELFDGIKETTSGLFEFSVSTRSAIITGLTALQKNFVDGSYSIDSNATWRDRLYIAFTDLFKRVEYTDGSGNMTFDAELVFQDAVKCVDMGDTEYKAYLDSLIALGINIPPTCSRTDVVTEIEKYLLNEVKTKNYYLNGKFVLSDEERKLYVLVYEQLNPDDAKAMDAFTVDMPTGTGVDALGLDHDFDMDNYNIRFMVYTAPDPEKQLFLQYAPDVEVVWDCECNPFWGSDDYDSDRRLHVDLTGYLEDGNFKTGGGPSDPRGPYVTLFHEFGHYLDDILGDGDPDGDGYMTENYHLTEIIAYEVKEDIRANLEAYLNDPAVSIPLDPIKDSDKLDKIVDAIVGQKTGNETDGWDQNMIDAYNGLIAAYDDKSSSVRINTWDPNKASAAYEGLTDVYTGVTDNTISWGYGHDDATYWYDDKGALKTNIGKEFYAEAFSHTFTHSPLGQINITESCLDASMTIYNVMIDVSTQ